jgi:hypothetical protein
MIINLPMPLPCAQIVPDAGAQTLCRSSARTGYLSPLGDGVWELLPVCPEHQEELSAGLDGHILEAAASSGR